MGVSIKSRLFETEKKKHTDKDINRKSEKETHGYIPKSSAVAGPLQSTLSAWCETLRHAGCGPRPVHSPLQGGCFVCGVLVGWASVSLCVCVWVFVCVGLWVSVWVSVGMSVFFSSKTSL